ncbi:alanine racemase [Nocardia cyriacigeorgica]|uniref:Decarboxylase n=1 Tax=Nocardia cyriacigeorgica TaxID=135487 RepID=A0A5R8NPH5_9NOCA|nr:alanine racemase [Nocardia cyriacigeorgica]TLF77521.1 decarboxylase [Nocardia cyriacigeorgica]
MTAPALPGLIDPMVREFLAERASLEAALARYGSPLNVVFPQVFEQNLGRLQGVLNDRQLPYRICYAHKVNQAHAFVRAAADAGIGIDVASAGELASARRGGFAPGRIEATGPKGAGFLRQLIEAGVTVNVDNQWELEMITELAVGGPPVPVLVRVSGFDPARVSRFGIPLARMDRALRTLAAHRDRIDLRGFAFHLDSGDVGERVRAFDDCLTLIERAYEHGLTPSVLDIGGGLRQVFTADATDFDRYVRALRDSLAGLGAPMSWGNTTFGYQVDGGAVRGVPVFHKYANTIAADHMLAELLDAPLERHGGRTVAQVAADNLLELWLEPGKALVDHAGITVAAVEVVKEAADGSVLVDLDISRDAVTPADQEVMVDPLVLPGDAREVRDPVAVQVFFAGRLCLERDLITNRLVSLPWLPRPGDRVVFPNTAAYHMDLSAATASMRPPAAKVAVTRDGSGFQVCADAAFRAESAAGLSEVR